MLRTRTHVLLHCTNGDVSAGALHLQLRPKSGFWGSRNTGLLWGVQHEAASAPGWPTAVSSTMVTDSSDRSCSAGAQAAGARPPSAAAPWQEAPPVPRRTRSPSDSELAGLRGGGGFTTFFSSATS